MGHPPEEDWKQATAKDAPDTAEPDAAADQELRFKVGGREYRMASFDDLTYDEIEMIEDAFDKPLEEIDIRRAKAQRWMIYISLRRAGQNVKFEELGQIKFTDVQDADEADVGPTSPDAAGK